MYTTNGAFGGGNPVTAIISLLDLMRFSDLLVIVLLCYTLAVIEDLKLPTVELKLVLEIVLSIINWIYTSE